MNTTTYSLIEIIGDDSETFLQGQLTVDMRAFASGECRLGAYCDHKGRAIASFFLLKPHDNHEGFWLVLPKDMVDIFCQSIGKYAVFSKVTITPSNDKQVICQLKPDSDSVIPDSDPGPSTFKLPGEPDRHLCITTTETDSQVADQQAWQWAQLQAGICLITEELSGKLIPLMLNYDQFNGISFDKGCYLGQEVLARMHFRGQLKRYLYPLKLQVPVAIGDDVTDEKQQVVGIVTATAINPDGEPFALAVIRDAAIENPLLINQQRAERTT